MIPRSDSNLASREARKAKDILHICSKIVRGKVIEPISLTCTIHQLVNGFVVVDATVVEHENTLLKRERIHLW
jgi:hypothetical protein